MNQPLREILSSVELFFLFFYCIFFQTLEMDLGVRAASVCSVFPAGAKLQFRC